MIVNLLVVSDEDDACICDVEVFFLQRVKKEEEKRGQDRKKRRKKKKKGEADAGEPGLRRNAILRQARDATRRHT